MGLLMLQEILNGIECCDGQYLKLADADVEFISTNAGNKGNKLNPERGLVRYQLMEIISRLAIYKFYRSKWSKSMSEAISLFIDDKFIKFM